MRQLGTEHVRHPRLERRAAPAAGPACSAVGGAACGTRRGGSYGRRGPMKRIGFSGAARHVLSEIGLRVWISLGFLSSF